MLTILARKDCGSNPEPQKDYTALLRQLIEYSDGIYSEVRNHNRHVTIDLNPLLEKMNLQIATMKGVEVNTALTVREIANATERLGDNFNRLLDQVMGLDETFISASREMHNAINNVANANSAREVDAIDRLARAVAAPRPIESLTLFRFDKLFRVGNAPAMVSLAAGICELMFIPECYDYKFNATHYECGKAASVEFRSVDTKIVVEKELIIELPANAIFHLLFNSIAPIIPEFAGEVVEYFGEFVPVEMGADEAALLAAISDNVTDNVTSMSQS